MHRVLLVADGAHPLRADLAAFRYEVLTAERGDAALDVIVAEELDLIVLDLGSPDADEKPAIADLRAWTPVPIIVLAERKTPADAIDALDAGADDYLAKPLSVAELVARFRAIARRQERAPQPTSVRVGRCHVDLSNHKVDAVEGRPVSLTRTEWRLLEALVTAPGRLITQRQLLELLWGPASGSKGANLRQYMAQLRRKFEVDPARPRHLLTEFGVGCRFQP